VSVDIYYYKLSPLVTQFIILRF